MSQLETNVRPFILELLISKRRIATLNRRERKILALWTAKTAFVLDAGAAESHVPINHLRELYRHPDRLADRVAIFARQQPATGKWFYVTAAGGSMRR